MIHPVALCLGAFVVYAKQVQSICVKTFGVFAPLRETWGMMLIITWGSEMKRLLFLIVCVGIWVNSAHADPGGRVAGTVVDRETGDPIPNANVIVVGTPFGASVDAQGRYAFSELPEGVYLIRASRVGYHTDARPGVVVRSGRAASLDFRLERIPLPAPEIVVTAARREQTSRMTSATVDVVSAAEMVRRGVVTFDRAMEYVPGVVVHRSSQLTANAVSIRGACDLRGGGIGNRVLLLMDGRPAIAGDTGGADWSLLPVDVVERVEVVKGPFSALYGSNAMGGVVNLITRSAGGAGRTRIRMDGGFFGRPPEEMRYREGRSLFGNAGATRSGRVSRVGYLFHISGGRSEGHRQNSDFTMQNGYAKARYASPGGTDLTAAVAIGRMERGYPHTWRNDPSRYPYLFPLEVAPHHGNDRQEKRILSWDLRVDRPIGTHSKLSTRIYRQENRSRSLLNPDGRTDDLYEFPPGFRLDSDASGTGGAVQIDAWNLPGGYWIFGADARREEVYGQPDSILYGRRRAEGAALFAQTELVLQDDLNLSVGARCDWRWTQSRCEGQFSPKVGIAWRPDASTTLRASMARAFRSPSLAELYLKREINAGLWFRHNPRLRAERVHISGEIGVRREVEGRAALDVTAFLYEFRDMVFWRRLSSAEYQAVNLNRARMSGLEVAVEMRRVGGSFGRIGYALLNARDLSPDRSDDALPYKPRHTGHVALGYRRPPVEIDAGLRYVGEVEEVVFYPNDRPEAFYTVDARLEWVISDLSDHRRIALSFLINNALDRQYEEMARYRMPGRSFSTQMTMEW